MQQNLRVIGAQDFVEAGVRRDERAAQAHALLRREWLDAFDQGARTLVSAPTERDEQMPLVDTVIDTFCIEDDKATLVMLLDVLRAAVDAEQPLAMAVASRLAHSFAARMTDYLNELGTFNE